MQDREMQEDMKEKVKNLFKIRRLNSCTESSNVTLTLIIDKFKNIDEFTKDNFDELIKEIESDFDFFPFYYNKVEKQIIIDNKNQNKLIT